MSKRVRAAKSPQDRLLFLMCGPKAAAPVLIQRTCRDRPGKGRTLNQNDKSVATAQLRLLSGGPLREGLSPLDELCETSGVAYGHVCQNFAVDRDAGCLQTVDQLAVGDTVETGGGTDALNPQAAVFAFLDATIALGIAIRTIGGFLSGLVELALCEEEAFGPLEILLAPSPALCAAFYAWHGFFSFVANWSEGHQ